MNEEQVRACLKMLDGRAWPMKERAKELRRVRGNDAALEYTENLCEARGLDTGAFAILDAFLRANGAKRIGICEGGLARELKEFLEKRETVKA